MKPLLGLVLAILLQVCGCPAGYYAQPDRQYYYGGIAPEFYGGDPALEQWYTYPYWNPERR